MNKHLYNTRLIDKYREQHGGIRSLGRATGMNSITLARMLAGENVSIKTLRKFADSLQIPICKLVDCSDAKKSQKHEEVQPAKAA